MIGDRFVPGTSHYARSDDVWCGRFEIAGEVVGVLGAAGEEAVETHFVERVELVKLVKNSWLA